MSIEHPVWRFFRSVKLAIVIVSLLAIGTIIGTLVLQESLSGFTPDELHSLWVIVILGAIVCVLGRGTLRVLTMKSIGLLLAVCCLMVSCGPGDRVEITQTATRSRERGRVRVNATNSERFRFAMTHSPAASLASESASPFHWTPPEGWEELPSTQYRLANFRVGRNREAECYLSVLPGGAGGVFANANRWREQMGLAPYTQTEFEELPTATVLGASAVLVEFDGAYSGMSQGASREGFRLKGALLAHQGSSVFVKLVGPVEIVEEESERFAEFLESIHPPAPGHVDETVAVAGLPPGHVPVDAETSVVAGSPTGGGGFAWEAPEGWNVGPARPMRLVTFTVGAQDEAECYVAILGPGAGGMAMNLNRWRGQFSLSPLSEDELAALPRIGVLGEPVPLLEAAGDFAGMGGIKQTGQALFGAARFLEDKSVFIKMTGPEDLIKTEKENFVAFCSSLLAQG